MLVLLQGLIPKKPDEEEEKNEDEEEEEEEDDSNFSEEANGSDIAKNNCFKPDNLL